MSVAYRQTISDEMAARIDERRGLLSLQEFTTLALVAALEQPSVAELQRQIEQLCDQIARQSAPLPPAPALPVALLTF